MPLTRRPHLRSPLDAAPRLRGLAAVLVVVALVIATAGASSARPHFAYKRVEKLGSGGFPTAVAVADFNKDGRPDMVVARDSSSSVGLLLGTGHGRFAKAKQLTTETDDDPSSVAVGDLNGDNKPDIVAANKFGDSVAVLIGKGNGKFRAPVLVGVGSIPQGVAVADLDGDHHADIVTANSGSDDISVLDGTGCGWPGSPSSCTTVEHFQPEETFALPQFSNAYGIAVKDLNGDRAPDIAVADQGVDGVTLFRSNGGDGPHGFAKGVTVKLGASSAPEWIAIADLNRDGHPDVIATGLGIHVILDARQFTKNANTKTIGKDSFRGLAVGRLDKGKWPDVVVGDQNANHLVIYRGTGKPSLLARASSLKGSAQSAAAAIADLDKHGPPDIVAVQELGSHTEVFLAK